MRPRSVWNHHVKALGCALLLLLGTASGTPALAQDSFIDKYEGNAPLTSGRKEWRESKQIEFPEVPRDGDLVALDAGAIGGGYDYYIDPKSVTLGSDDVTRYTVVLESSSGARSIYYEGIHCETSRTRTYAYASRESEFRPLAASEWKRVYAEGPFAYRPFLEKEFICDAKGWPLEPTQVRKRLAQHSSSGARFRHDPFKQSK